MILKRLGFVFAGERNKIVDDQSRIVEGCGYVVKHFGKTSLDAYATKFIYMIKDIVIPEWTDTSKADDPTSNTLSIGITVEYGNGLSDGSLSLEYEIREDAQTVTQDEYDGLIFDQDDYSVGDVINSGEIGLFNHFGLCTWASTDRNVVLQIEKDLLACCSNYETKLDFWIAINKYRNK